jgi:hypothetical protein
MFAYYWKQVAGFYIPRFSARIAQAILSLFIDSTFLTVPRDDRMEVLRHALRSDSAGVWPLIGEVLLREDEAGYRLRLSMKDWGVEEVETPLLLAWAEGHRPRGAQILAGIARVGGDPLAPLPRHLLIRYGHDESIGRSLGASFLSGFWMGLESQWLQAKLDIARNWLNDEHASVRSWAQEIVEWIEADIRRVQRREEEEELWH